MKTRTNLYLVVWAIGGIALAVTFFTAWFQHGGDNNLSGAALLGCFLWNILLWRLILRK